MIQVLGLRDRTDKSGRKREVFFGKNWRFEKIQDVFDREKNAQLLEKIPTEEQYNLYFTVADCFEENGRKLKEQWAIPFDIDDIHIESEKTIEADAMLVAETALEVLGVNPKDCGIIFSGHGVQLFILLDKPILSDDYFDSMRAQYAGICAKIQAKLNEKNIKGKVDTSVFSGARLMRFPNTENRKPKKPTRKSLILNSAFSPVELDLNELSGVRHVERAESIPSQVLRSYPKPDTKAICGGCAFLKHCKDKPGEISEPQWYAMQSITARLDNGRDLTHAMSEGHPGYTHYETELKIDQALKSSGPRTCKNIDTLWGKCHTCEYVDKVVSPILIRGKDYVGSADFGFRERKEKDDGTIIAGRPVYDDLIKHFGLIHPYKILKESTEVCYFDGKIWVPMFENELRAWVAARLKPSASSAEMQEFVQRLKAQYLTSKEWFMDSTNQKLSFKNCVLNVSTGEVTAHNPDYGFFNTLPFDYDKNATSPTWDKFLKDITANDQGTMEVLEEYAGYCISGDDCWLQKALLIVGEGANGKSTFMETIGNIVGRNNRSTIGFQDLANDTKKYLLVNKLFNFSEETSSAALFDSTLFKNLTAGGYMTVKQLYAQPYEIKNRAKFILAANELPYSTDKNFGFARRLVLVKLDQQFVPGVDGYDPFIQDKLNSELAGICNKLIAAYSKMRERRSLTLNFNNKQNVDEYLLESNNVARFFHESIVQNGEAECTAHELYDEYRAYCEQNGEKSIFTNNKFIILLKKHLPLDNMRDLQRRNGKPTRIYKGIELYKNF